MSKFRLRNLLSFAKKRFLQAKATPQKPLPLDSSLLASKSLQNSEENSSNFLSVFNCLKSHGFDDAGAVELVKKRPAIIHCKVNEKLKPKLEYLNQKGLTGELLSQIILSKPLILFRSLDHQIKPVFEFMQPYLNDKELLIALKRSLRLLTFSLNAVLQPNVDLLIFEGVPVSRITKLITFQSGVILQSHDRMVYAVKTVIETGLGPKEPNFIHALRVVCSMSELNWKRKMEVFMNFGWSKENVFSTLKKDPLCFASSAKKVGCLMDFYVNTMKSDVKTIIEYPKMLHFLYPIDERVLRRYKISLVTLNEKKFLVEYVTKFEDEVPGLLDMYKAAIKQTNPTRGKRRKFDTNIASFRVNGSSGLLEMLQAAAKQTKPTRCKKENLIENQRVLLYLRRQF